MSEDNEITFKTLKNRKCKQRIAFSSKLLIHIKGTSKVIHIMNSGVLLPFKRPKYPEKH